MLTVFNIIDSDLKCNCYTHPILMGCILVKKEYYLPFDKYKIKRLSMFAAFSKWSV